MSDNNPSSGLIAAIIFSSTVISGSLVFFGLQYFEKDGFSEKELQAKIFAGIGSYIENKQQEYETQQAEANKPKFVEGDFTDDDAVLGDKDAPITIVEFSDYQCPFCESFYSNALPDIKKKYIDNGKAKLIYRDYPLSFHPEAYPAALIAECVRDQTDDEAYYKMHDYIFKNIAGGFNFETYAGFAETIGANKQKLKDCFDSDKFKEEIYADQKDGEKAGVRGTPGFLVNGWLISGAQPFQAFEEVIEKELAN